MRQSSYNYFQHHGAGSSPSALRTPTFRSSLGRSPASRKRQRTLAEQLDELCLQGSREAGGSRIVELDEFGREKAASVDGSGSDSDGMMDVTGESAGLKVYGTAANVNGLRSFFAAGAGERHRPMDRMYRHYGNEIVVFRPPAQIKQTLAGDLPAYLSLTPHEFEKLSMAEKKQWYQAHSRYMRELDHAAAKNDGKVEMQMEAKPTEAVGGFETSRRRSSSASSSSYQVLGVPSTDEEEDAAFDYFEDVEMMEDIEDDAAPKCPHAAGALTHTEWFTDDEL
eukprot:jgi/Phyca11/562055/estExt2_Genewise1.C_PHYCAscaffold_80497